MTEGSSVVKEALVQEVTLATDSFPITNFTISAVICGLAFVSEIVARVSDYSLEVPY